jgi:hypothetical protein
MVVSVAFSGCGVKNSQPVIDDQTGKPESILQWKDYKNETEGFVLSYPENFQVEEKKELNEETKHTGTSFVFPEEDLFKTIFESRVNVVVKKATECANLTVPHQVEKKEDVVKNGMTFSQYVWQEAAAGNQYGGTIYQTFKNGKCFRVSFFAHTTTPANYAKSENEAVSLQEEHDATMNGLSMIFDRIVSTFRIL